MDNEVLLENIKQLLNVHVASLDSKLEQKNADLKERLTDLKSDFHRMDEKLENKIVKISEKNNELEQKFSVLQTELRSKSSIWGAIGGFILGIVGTIITRMFG